jgi:ACS family D-galactonate transporter-like MFS transporter
MDLGIGYDLAGVLMALWISASAIAALILSRYIDKVNIFRFAILELAILSISSLLTAFSSNLIMLSFARILLSFSMPFIWPICTKIVSMHYVSNRYGYSTALYNIGSMIGLASTYIIMALIGSSWRISMIIASILGFIYAIVMFSIWRTFIRGKEVNVKVRSKDVGKSNGLSNNISKLKRDFVKLGIMLFAAFFFALYTWGFIVNWLSTFLIYELKYDYSYVAIYMVFIAIVASFLEINAGIYSDKVGGLEGKVRILYMGLIPSAILLLSTVISSNSLAKMISITLSIIMYRIATPSFWSIVNEVIPISYVGRFGAIYTLAGPFSGIASSVINGYIVALANSIKYGIVLSAILLFLSTLLYSIVKRFYKNK